MDTTSEEDVARGVTSGQFFQQNVYHGVPQHKTAAGANVSAALVPFEDEAMHSIS